MSQSENRSSTNEESGWTTYLEDFSLMNNNQSSHENYSLLLSDVASSHHTNYNQLLVVNDDDQYSPKKLNLKKLPRNKKINDPDLEDTASSPVNSPKVSNFKKMEINYRRTENSTGNFLGNEGSSRQFQEMQKVERGNISLENNGYTDLKKKGLCLVPLSMLVNYHG